MGVDVLDLMDLPQARPMNRDLEEWMAGAGQAAAQGPPGETGTARGPCRDCAKPAERSCLRCGASACSRHYRVMYGLCLHCSPEAEAAEDADRGRPDLDIPWIG